MIRKQIYLSEEMNAKLQYLAKNRNLPQAEVIREGLEQYLTIDQDKEEKWEQLMEEMKNSAYSELEWNRERAHDRSH